MSSFTKLFLLPILLITILCISAVEVFYHFGEKYLLSRDNKQAELAAPAAVSDKQKIVKDFKKPIDYSIITRRNLFASQKGSDIKVKEEDTAPAVELSAMDVVLMGTVSGGGDGERAIIYDKKDKKQELFQVGDYIQQAIIKQIERGKVILNLNGKDEMLDISEARNVKIPRVAKVNPVVQTRKVVGRPVGQRVNNGTGQSVDTNGIPGGVQPGSVPVKRPKQLRSYRGGVIVKDKQATP